MKQLLIVILIMLYGGCGLQEDYVPMIELEEDYLCETHKIQNRSSYSFNVKHKFRMRIIDFSGDGYSIEKLENRINNKLLPANISMDIVLYEEFPAPDTVDYKYKFDKHFQIGYINMLVFPDSVKLVQTNREGAANGIPELDNVSLGRPIFFVKKHALFQNDIGILIHELGHIFGLKHLFEGYDMHNKGLNCDAGDNIPDVVTLPRQGSVSPRSCSYFVPREYIENYTTEEINKATVNYMSYSPPTCLTDFSDAQIERMRKMVEVNPLLQYAKTTNTINNPYSEHSKRMLE